MSKLIQCHWAGTGSGQTRRDRMGCDYSAYLPDRVSDRTFALNGAVAADVAEAESAILRLNAGVSVLTNTEGLARILLRAEAVASSRIEGLEVGARRLLHAEFVQASDENPKDVTASEVLANIEAMTYAMEIAGQDKEITLDTILEMNKLLLAPTRSSSEGGVLRNRQNWIGGSGYHPCSASFVPPPEDHVLALMEDLVKFCNEEGLPPVVQAAIAHAQFETIHPFVDGNGRTGRTLIHLILKRRGLANRVLTPVSLILATWSKAYIDALTAYRYEGEADSDVATEGINVWISQFASACTRACSDAESFENRVKGIQNEWRSTLGSVRKDSSADRLIAAIPGIPVLTISSAASVIERTFPAVSAAIQLLVEAGILRQITDGKRNRAYEAPAIIEAFIGLERQLGSPEGNTRYSRPSRRVPHRHT